jgi:hypothetical protein
MKSLLTLPLFAGTDSPVTRPARPASYPEAPGFKAAGASQDAAEAIAGSAKTLRARALAVIAQSPDGLTADEVALSLDATPFAIRPRITELKRLGLIEPAKERRKNESGMSASVWRLAKLSPFERPREDRQ